MKIYNEYSIETTNDISEETLIQMIDFIERQDNVIKVNNVFTGDDKYKDVKGYTYDFKNKNIVVINVEVAFDIEQFDSYDENIDYTSMEGWELMEIFSEEMSELFSEIEGAISKRFKLDKNQE